MKIRVRLFTTYFGTILLGTCVLAMIVLWSFERFFIASVEDDLGARAKAIADTIGDAMERGNLDVVALVVRRYGAQESITIRVFGPDARLIATSDEGDRKVSVDFSGNASVRRALEGSSERGRGPALVGEGERSYVTLPVTRGGRTLGVVRMSRALDELRAEQRATVWIIVGALGAILVLCALIADRLARGLARPIEGMRNFAVRLGAGHLGEKLAVEGADEVSELATELERMSVRLSAIELQRRAFLANVAHELRTPVSNILVTLQALESGAGDDPELRARFLKTALDETDRMRRLVTDLLELGAIEAGVIGLDRVPVALSDVIHRCVRAIEPRATARGVALAEDVDTGVKVVIDPERITQALLNILDNALKFSPSDGHIRVVGREIAGRAEIRVTDEGPGIAAADLPQVFEQFYTGDRSRRRGGTGLGLGLAIARRIVDAHHGTLSAASVEGRGATFTLELPIEPLGARTGTG